MLIRLKENTCLTVDTQKGIGTRFVRCDDPDGQESGDLEEVLILDPGFPKLSRRQYNAWLSLNIVMMGDQSQNSRVLNILNWTDSGDEVGAFITEDKDGVLHIWVMEQKVGSAEVDYKYSNKCIHIVTGEVMENGILSLQAAGHILHATTHSHNSMPAFFSKTDDKSELKIPGLHFVVGDWKKEKDGDQWSYDTVWSVVMKGRRYEMIQVGDEAVIMGVEHFVEPAEGEQEWGYHDSVDGMITKVFDYLAIYSRTSVTGGVHINEVCCNADCHGYIGNHGYCYTCDTYSAASDLRDDKIKDGEQNATPTFDKDGKIIGCTVGGVQVEAWITRRLGIRFGWDMEKKVYTSKKRVRQKKGTTKSKTTGYGAFYKKHKEEADTYMKDNVACLKHTMMRLRYIVKEVAPQSEEMMDFLRTIIDDCLETDKVVDKRHLMYLEDVEYEFKQEGSEYADA